MCIIIAKPAGVELPTVDTLDNCFTSNRDGIGFAFCKPNGRPIISKGFNTVKHMIKMWDTFNINKNDHLLVHFRLATHGAKDKGNCHPFPLTYDFEDMRRLHCSCDTAITHNGVFGQMKASEKYSDTMKFISNILASPEIISHLKSPSVAELIRGYCGYTSKLAFLRADGVTTIGEFKEDAGIFYSNEQYKSWENRNSTYNQNNTNWKKEGTQYCCQHQCYDKCHEDGKEWCYLHKCRDFCSYCQEHQRLDTCKHDKVIEDKKLLTCCNGDETVPHEIDLRTPKCEWCATKEDVTFNPDISAQICRTCATLYVHGYHD